MNMLPQVEEAIQVRTENIEVPVSFKVIVSGPNQGMYTAVVDGLPGCPAQGASVEEALEGLKDGLPDFILLYLKAHRQCVNRAA